MNDDPRPTPRIMSMITTLKTFGRRTLDINHVTREKKVERVPSYSITPLMLTGNSNSFFTPGPRL